MFTNQNLIERELLEHALGEFKDSTGFDFIDVIMDESLSDAYYSSDNSKDLTNYLEEAENTYNSISQIRDEIIRFI